MNSNKVRIPRMSQDHIHNDQDQHSQGVQDQHNHGARAHIRRCCREEQGQLQLQQQVQLPSFHSNDHSHKCCTKELGQLQLQPLVQLQLHACHSSDHIQAHGGHIHIHNA